MSTQATKVRDFGVDFSEISAANENHSKSWQYGMDTARLEFDSATLKREFMLWADVNNLENSEHFATLPDWRFVTLGRMAWLMNNGAEIPAESSEFFLTQIQKLRALQPEIAVVKEDSTSIPMTNDARKVIQYVNLYSYIDAVRVKYSNDTDKIEELVHKRIKDAEPPMALLRKVYNHFKETLDESINERENKLVADTIEPLVTVVNILAACTGNAKALAAVKKKVSAKSAKAASKAKVKIVDADTNIVGLSPVLIVGNSAALVYNTKNRKAMLYIAKSGETLAIKGTYITGFDENKSFGKTLRKPKEHFSKMLSNTNTKRLQQVLGEFIKGKRHELNGKLNTDTLIIKVFK